MLMASCSEKRRGRGRRQCGSAGLRLPYIAVRVTVAVSAAIVELSLLRDWLAAAAWPLGCCAVLRWMAACRDGTADGCCILVVGWRAGGRGRTI